MRKFIVNDTKLNEIKKIQLNFLSLYYIIESKDGMVVRPYYKDKSREKRCILWNISMKDMKSLK